MRKYLPKIIRRFLSNQRKKILKLLRIEAVFQNFNQPIELIRKEEHAQLCLHIDVLTKQINHLHNKILTVKVGKKLKVGFLVHNVGLFLSSYSVYQALDKECQVVIYALPSDEMNYKNLDVATRVDKTHQALIEHYGVVSQKINTFQDLQAHGIPDIIFLQTPYEEQRPDSISVKNLKLYTKICYIPYGICLATVPFFHYGLDFFNHCWKIFLESSTAIQMCKEYLNKTDFAQRENALVISGNPKVDIIKEWGQRTLPLDRCWSLAKADDIKRIIWAPHWTIEWFGKNGYSQFIKYFQFFLNLLSNKAKIDLVLRPHPMMFKELISKNEMTVAELDQFITEFTSYPNARIDHSVSYLDLFYTSDAMITDGVSFLSEYPLTMKPLLYTENNQNGPGLNSYGDKIVDALYKAHNEQQVNHFINTVVFEGKDFMYEKRIKMINEELYSPEIGVGLYIKENIFESLA